ncbi:hypothetical protein AAF712_003721 [Marasmius tenuissimus]|uniref:ER-bound oxygenase mpaB/mpaB'/Rubber oxygenase catalytic domain-containing protein n=1 Tax=Marasmius tenuissimus TaxID=585030 RepID=A0ABR3A643_9AGAR
MSPHQLRVPSSTGISRIDPSKPVKHTLHTSDTRELKYGDTIQFHGHLGVWDEDSVPEGVVLRWRKQGDPLCDGAIPQLASAPNGSNPSSDLLTNLEDFVRVSVAEKDSDSTSACHEFWKSISEPPPQDLCLTDEQFERARNLYLDHTVQISQAFLYYALGGGFASPRIVRTLEAVSYLVPSKPGAISPAANDRTYRRLLETLQFVLDVMRCSVPDQVSSTKGATHLMPHGEGWKSCVRVRMLHGTVRAKLRRKKPWNGDGSDEEDCPISQEDMSATLAGFSTIPLWTLTALGLTASSKDAEAFLALWRHVGFYMGVSPDILRRYWSTAQVADQFLSSMLIHVYAPLHPGDKGLVNAPTMPILIASANRPPTYNTLEWNCAVTHSLLGCELATYLKVPEPTWDAKLKLRVMLIVQAFPVLFTRYYGGLLRNGWLEKKRWAYAVNIALTLRRSLGNRRTKFRPGGQEGAFGKLQWEDESIPEHKDKHMARKANWALYQVMGEMLAVLVGCGGATALLMWKAYPFMVHYYFGLKTRI